ncbi:MAG: replicative DNA helicase [archaeon]
MKQEKEVPKNIKAEKSLLGGIIMDGEAVNKVIDFLEEGDFYENKHQKIYKGIKKLAQNHKTVDLVSLSDKLEEMGVLESIGGSSYLTGLVNQVPTSSHVEEYGKIVQKKRMLRDLIHTGQEIALKGYNQDGNIENLLDEAEKSIFSIGKGSVSNKFLYIGDEADNAYQRIEELIESDDNTRGLPTGFDDLDDKLSGLQDSDLIILAGRPSMGKSSMAFNIAHNIAKKDVPVGIFSLEMSADQIIDKFIASESGVDLWKIRNGHIEKGSEELKSVKRASESFRECPIYIEDKASFNVMQMKAMARRLQAENGLGLLIIDYLQLIEPGTSYQSKVQQMTEISRNLKMIAKELKIPVIALSQLSRAVETRRPPVPRLSDLRETGALEQDADVVLTIYREDYYYDDTERKNIADINIAKHRNGPIGKVELYFDENTTTFQNLSERRDIDY